MNNGLWSVVELKRKLFGWRVVRIVSFALVNPDTATRLANDMNARAGNWRTHYKALPSANVPGPIFWGHLGIAPETVYNALQRTTGKKP